LVGTVKWFGKQQQPAAGGYARALPQTWRNWERRRWKRKSGR